MTSPVTARDRAKAERSDAILHAAARLFAARGYSGVSLEDIGAAVGVSGPAVYRHFAGKQALLGAVLVKVSQDLISGGRRVAAESPTADQRMRALIGFHVEFALGNAEVIQVQDRDVAFLSEADRAEVRRLQRAYIELWMAALSPLQAPEGGADQDELRSARAGLLRAHQLETPHSTRTAARRHSATATVLIARWRMRRCARLPEEHRPSGLFEDVGDVLEESCSFGSVDEAVVEGEAERHHLPQRAISPWCSQGWRRTRADGEDPRLARRRMGVPASTPKTPMLEIENVPPASSAGEVFPERATSASDRTASAMPSSVSRSASRIIGTISPRSVAAAIPRST